MTDKTLPTPALITVASATPTRAVGELTDSIAPMPTRRTVRMRTFVPYQAYRFGMVNLKMIKMVRRSHTH
jgi:hypothetical protein